MKPSAKAEHLLGQSKPRLVRTKRVLGELANGGQSEWSRKEESREAKSAEATAAADSSDFIGVKARHYEDGFTAYAITRDGTEIKVEAAGVSSVSPTRVGRSGDFLPWRMTITPTKSQKGFSPLPKVIEGRPFWDITTGHPQVADRLDLKIKDTKHHSFHLASEYNSSEEHALYETVSIAFDLLTQADDEGKLEVKPDTSYAETEAA